MIPTNKQKEKSLADIGRPRWPISYGAEEVAVAAATVLHKVQSTAVLMMLPRDISLESRLQDNNSENDDDKSFSFTTAKEKLK